MRCLCATVTRVCTKLRRIGTTAAARAAPLAAPTKRTASDELLLQPFNFLLYVQSYQALTKPALERDRQTEVQTVLLILNITSAFATMQQRPLSSLERRATLEVLLNLDGVGSVGALHALVKRPIAIVDVVHFAAHLRPSPRKLLPLQTSQRGECELKAAGAPLRSAL